MSILKKLFGTTNRQENKSGEIIVPKKKCSPEREFGSPRDHNYKAINVEKHESGRYEITYECADCGDIYGYYTPFENLLPYGGGSAGYGYDDLAIDCYEAERYALATEFAQKAFDLKCNQSSMMAIMLIVSIMDGNLEKTLDACDKYYTLFYTYNEVSKHIFHIKDILEHAAKYMIDNRKPEFAYMQEQGENKLPMLSHYQY
jgi:hypothetical protein